MIDKLLNWFKRPRPTSQVEVALPPPEPNKYSRATHKIYYEVLYQYDLKGRRAFVRFYPYDNKSKHVEVVVEDSNQTTLEMKVARVIEQRMSKGKL